MSFGGLGDLLNMYPFQYEPYKPASKLALSERARAIGLQEPAELLLYGETDELPLMPYLNIDVPGLETLHKVSEGMQHIGAHLICKDARVLDELRKLYVLSIEVLCIFINLLFCLQI